MMEFVWPVVVLAGLGLFFGVLLAFASKKFAIQVDERVENIRALLPGANCGACGYPGCDGLAAAIAEGRAPVNACTVGGALAAQKIADVMGVEAENTQKKVAYILCNGSHGNTREIFDYDGIHTCAGANIYGGGSKACRFACVGYGDCVKACKFGALSVVNGKSTIDYSKCTGCGMCAKTCPKGVIDMLPDHVPVVVSCRNVDSGKSVREVCSHGCIGCKKCEKSCEQGAIKVFNGFSHIDYTKCNGCGTCADNCPVKCIIKPV